MSSRSFTNDDYNFVDLVYDDIKQFLDNPRGQRALLFPAVNPRRRYLIHNTVQENFPQLTTLSVGQGDRRRTAVTFKKQNGDDKSSRDGSPCGGSDRQANDAVVKKQKQQQQQQKQQLTKPEGPSEGHSQKGQQQQQQSQGRQSHSQSQPHNQSQSHSQSQPTQQHSTAKSEEKPTDRAVKEGRRPEQQLYSPQRQGSQQRIDLKKDTQQQQQQIQVSKRPVQLNQGTPQKQQQQQQSSVKHKALSEEQQETQSPSQLAQQKQKQQQQQPATDRNPKGQRDPETNKQPQQQQQQRPGKRRSSSCNSGTRSRSNSRSTRGNSNTLETSSERLRNDEPMRDSGAEESQGSSRKRRNRRNRRQKERTAGGIGDQPQCPSGHNDDRGIVNGKRDECHKTVEGGRGRVQASQLPPSTTTTSNTASTSTPSRKSKSVQNLSGTRSVVTVRDAACDDRVGSSLNRQTELNGGSHSNNSSAVLDRACESDPRKFMKSPCDEVDNWRNNAVSHRHQDIIRSPISSRKEEYRESGSSSPSDTIGKHSPERMPVIVPSEQGNNRRRGKAAAQIYRPPPARSTRDPNPPPQQQQQQQHHQPFHQQQLPVHQQQPMQLHQPHFSQPFQPKQQYTQSHYHQSPQHPYSSHPSHNYYPQQHNYFPHHQEFQHYHSLPSRQRTDSESSTATTSGDYQNNKGGKGRRPDQVLYVPRGRRHVPADSASARGTPTPILDYESNHRPPSPAYSICSTASEYSGRNRYNKQGSRQGSQISIYDGETDRIQGKPPLSRDFSRESTPGYGRQKVNGGGTAGRFSSHTLQLIERCLNQDSDHRYSEYSNGEADALHSTSSPKNNKGGGGRNQKSPTPTRDFHSIHSKENVIHPIEPSPRSRRSRKNRRRHSRSREPSADQYNNGTKEVHAKGSVNENGDLQNSPGERGLGSCERIFYNSSFNSSQERYDRGYDNYDRYSSINSSRASSRNSSRERTPQQSPHHNWRVSSNPSSPTKGPIVFYQSKHSPGKPPSGRLGSLPNVALDFGESTRKVSNCNEENQRYHTLPVKSKNPDISNHPTQVTDKNIEYGSGCMISDRIEPNSHNGLSQNTTQENDLIHQNDSLDTYDSHREELAKNLINSSCNTTHKEPIKEIINDLKHEEVKQDEDQYNSSIMSENSLNTSVNSKETSLYSDSVEENHKNDSESDSKDILPCDSMNKSTDLITSGTASDEEVYYEMEAESSLIESNKDSAEEITSSDNDTKDGNLETKENCDRDKEKKNPKKFQFNWADEVEDSWDNLYDDNGECLDPEIKRQLSDSLGKIKLEKPANDYYTFQPKEVEINEEEYAHVIEIYDFPTSFKTQDLMMVFSSFQNTGFDIKWVDDTHALGIFATALIAAEALSVDHPFLKTRSLSLATKSSKAKAMRITEALLPYKPRPATSASLARRLVSGALGLKVNISREVREAEKQKLKDAKAQKRLAAKQRVDAWEGNLT